MKNAFLHGHLDETVYCQRPLGYCQRPLGFVDPASPDHVCLLQKSLYGLMQAPRTWYQHFATYLQQLSFIEAASDTSLFVYKEGPGTAYLLLYIEMTSSSPLRHQLSFVAS